jgi:hypothetical protein
MLELKNHTLVNNGTNIVVDVLLTVTSVLSLDCTKKDSIFKVCSYLLGTRSMRRNLNHYSGGGGGGGIY